ncbi:formyltransferase family protein [Kitasatospora viridis]|nr:formyltransferase family protein [Kitasatospora viridis]
MGSDVTSHLIVNRLISVLRGADVSFVLGLTRGKTSAERPLPLRQLFFVEHTLLQEHAYPYIDAHGLPAAGRFNTPNGWQRLGLPDVEVRHVKSVNDPEFIAGLQAEGIDLAVSVRCYQKFKSPILQALGGPDSGSLFVNLHPGLLPEFRGVNTFLRSMQQGAREAGFTLHHLEEGWDTGPVIAQTRFPLSYSRSVHENLLAHVADAASPILQLILDLVDGQKVSASEQDHSLARYFSYPTEDELDALRGGGIEIFRASSVVDALTDAFFGSLPDPAGLREHLTAALEAEGIPYEYPRGPRTSAVLVGEH